MDMESDQIWDQKAGCPQGRSQRKENVCCAKGLRDELRAVKWGVWIQGLQTWLAALELAWEPEQNYRPTEWESPHGVWGKCFLKFPKWLRWLSIQV